MWSDIPHIKQTNKSGSEQFIKNDIQNMVKLKLGRNWIKV